MVTIQLPDNLVRKLQTHGVDNLDAFVASVIEGLRDDEIQAIGHQNVEINDKLERRIAALQAATVEFRKGISSEEWSEISLVMNNEYIEEDDLPDGNR